MRRRIEKTGSGLSHKLPSPAYPALSSFLTCTVLSALLALLSVLLLPNIAPGQSNSTQTGEAQTQKNSAVSNSPAPKTGTVYFIRSRSFAEITIDQAYTVFVEKSIAQAEADPEARAIILEIDTPGGRVDSALKIKDIILAAHLPVYGYINSHAISAGALLALTTSPLVMVDGAVIGDAAPVYQKGGGTERAGEKAVSALRAVFAALAQRHGRPEILARAMVDSDIILTESIHGINKPKDKLLTLSAQEALRLDMADQICNSLPDLLKTYNLLEHRLVYLDYTATDQLISFLNHPIMTSILLTLGMLGLIFEVKTPGWGVGGTIGILALTLFFLSQILTQHTTWGAPILFVMGLVLIMLELFVIPGFGLVGVAGFTLVLFSFLAAIGIDNLRYGGTVLAVSLVATALLSTLLFKFFPKTRTFSRIILAGSSQSYHSPTDHDQSKIQPGAEGRTVSILRPAGTIIINGERLDAVSQGDFIAAGTEIEVVKVAGSRLVVRPREGSES